MITKLESSDVLEQMDPRLQRAVEQQRRGVVSAATASTERGEIAVIARVEDPEAFFALADVRPGAEIGGARSGGCIVTARIPVARIEEVRSAPGVISLKAGVPVRPALAATVTDLRAGKLLPKTAKGKQGKGVVVGIVDFGGDFAHRNFHAGKNKTRVLALWDQNGTARPDSPFGYGRVFLKKELDAALKTGTPYETIGYALEAGSHGTHVMDIAAGNGKGTKAPGVAPQADLIFVEVGISDIPWVGPGVVGSTFGDSIQLLEAVKFIFDRAGKKPCVINISLGTNGGPHDGTSLVEQGLDALINEKPNRAVVIAASNSYAHGIHAAGKVPPGGHVDLPWLIGDNDATQNELEIWYSGKDTFRLEVLLPDGKSLGFVEPGGSATAKDGTGRTLLFIAHRIKDPNNGDNNINAFLERGVPAGRWTFRLHAVTADDGAFHAWIERDDGGQSRFAPPLDNTHTLGSISCGEKSIAVGSYDAHKAATPLSFFSSAGPTRDGRQKPEVSAPGHSVMAAASTSVDGVVTMSGTSMAAPAVTGLVALVLAEAKAAGRSLTADEIREIVSTTARPVEPGKWHDRYGHGRVSAAAAVTRAQEIRGQEPNARLVTRSGSSGKTKAAGKGKDADLAPVALLASARRATARSRR